MDGPAGGKASSIESRGGKVSSRPVQGRARAGKLSLTVQYACNDPALPLRTKLRRWVGAALAGGALRGELTLRFVDEGEGRALNRDFRGKDYATNVLSFPYAPLPEMAGDLVLCLPVVLAEAEAQGKSAEAHFAHLVVHGMLHLQGYDHEKDDQAMLMEAKEQEILAQLGYPDPY